MEKTNIMEIGQPFFFQGIMVVYAGMPNENTFSLVISDTPLYFRKDRREIEHNEPFFRLMIVHVDPDFLEFTYSRV